MDKSFVLLLAVALGAFLLVVANKLVKPRRRGKRGDASVNVPPQSQSLPQSLPCRQQESQSEPVVVKVPLSKEDREKAGLDGERMVKEELELLNKHVTSFHDIQFEVKGKFCQIDHVVVSHNAIFVIETKHFKQGSVLEQVGVRDLKRIAPCGDILNVRNPYNQLVKWCRLLNDVIFEELDKNVTIQPLVVFVRPLDHKAVVSNIPSVFLPQLKPYICNYYTPYKLPEKRRAGIIKLCSRLKSGELYPVATSCKRPVRGVQADNGVDTSGASALSIKAAP